MCVFQHQKESYKRLKQLLLASQDKYQRLSVDMEEEKQKHQEYMMKSDDFVNLLGEGSVFDSKHTRNVSS